MIKEIFEVRQIRNRVCHYQPSRTGQPIYSAENAAEWIYLVEDLASYLNLRQTSMEIASVREKYLIFES